MYFALEAHLVGPISHENRVKMDPSRKVPEMAQTVFP